MERMGAGLVVLALLVLAMGPADAQLSVGFYKSVCPNVNVEAVVTKSITASYKADKGTAPGLLRMHFHDCFVKGCDGSVLVTSTATNTAERDAPPNKSLRGFQAIFDAKAAVEAVCPGKVSCADILAYAARDSVALSGGPRYSVPGGRRDGLTSLSTDVTGNLPGPQFTVAQLVTIFASNGLNTNDMVALSGAHTIGVANCASFFFRLSPTLDPTLNSTLAATLQALCPAQTTAAQTPMDSTNTRFDNAYYKGLKIADGVFQSDQNLFIDNSTNSEAVLFAKSQTIFFSKFVAAIIKMGGNKVLTGTAGQIRADCSIV